MLIHSIIFDRKRSKRTAVICANSGAAFSYEDLARQSEYFAATLHAGGLKPGDRAAILLPGSIEFVTAFFAVLRAGGVVAPVDIYMKKAEMLLLLERIRPRLLVTNRSLFRKIRSDVRTLPVCLVEYGDTLSVSFVDSEAPASSGFPRTDAETSSPRASLREAEPAEDAVLIMSSGSTGAPKAVRLSHRAILHNIRMHLESLRLNGNICGLQLLPMNFSYGLVASFLSILHSGGTAVLSSCIEPAPVLATVRKYDINVFMGTPTLFQYLLEKAGDGNDFHMSPLRCLTIGGDRCKRFVLDLVRQRLPAARVYITYGLSEAGPRVSTLPHEYVADLPGSVGLPLSGVGVSILDSGGRRCGPCEKGELVVTTPSMMSGYLDDPGRTRRVLRDGRCHTGDIGWRDAHGFLYISGRKDRQCKLGGRKVNPAFIEQCLCSHPGVREVVVTKVDDDHREALRASIRAKDACDDAFLDELKRLCRKNMPAYMVPREFILEEGDIYYHKGKRFDPGKKALPEEISCSMRTEEHQRPLIKKGDSTDGKNQRTNQQRYQKNFGGRSIRRHSG